MTRSTPAQSAQMPPPWWARFPHPGVGAMCEVSHVLRMATLNSPALHAAWTSTFFACTCGAMAAVTRSRPSGTPL